MSCLATVVLMVVIGVACADICCTPDQWEGYQASLAGYVEHRRPGLLKGNKHVYYDYTNMRSAALANFTVDGKLRAYRIVMRYDNSTVGKIYVVDLKSGKCFKKDLQTPFRKACIPDSAIDVGEYAFGAGEATLAAHGYALLIRSKKYKLEVFISVTQQNCVPVAESVIGEARGVSLLETVGFVNFRLNISDPSVFDVPSSCVEDAMPAVLLMGMSPDYRIMSF